MLPKFEPGVSALYNIDFIFINLVEGHVRKLILPMVIVLLLVEFLERFENPNPKFGTEIILLIQILGLLLNLDLQLD